jgi:hypothetical protein
MICVFSSFGGGDDMCFFLLRRGRRYVFFLLRRGIRYVFFPPSEGEAICVFSSFGGGDDMCFFLLRKGRRYVFFPPSEGEAICVFSSFGGGLLTQINTTSHKSISTLPAQSQSFGFPKCLHRWCIVWNRGRTFPPGSPWCSHSRRVPERHRCLLLRILRRRSIWP